jgi:hypothetical protein
MPTPESRPYLDMQRALKALHEAYTAVHEVIAVHAEKHEETVTAKRRAVEIERAIKSGASAQSGQV